MLRATRIVRSPHQLMDQVRREASPKLLLPDESPFQTYWNALQGAWAALTDQTSRDQLMRLMENGVIRESVLQQADYGSMRTFSLFHHLQDPLWKSLDFREFLSAVGPALENFNDLLFRLRDAVAADEEEQKEVEAFLKRPNEDVVKMMEEAKEGTSLTVMLLGNNRWQKKAEEDPESLEAIVAKMSTPQNLAANYYSSKFSSYGEGTRHHYVEGSCKIDNVAILEARVQEIDDREEKEDYDKEYVEFSASEEPERDLPIVARLDILCEMTKKYVSDTPIDLALEGDQTSKTHFAVTDLSVAILEGWLKGGPDQGQLRWRVAGVRQAEEFTYDAIISKD